MIGRHKESKIWQSWSKAWAQPDVLKRRKNIAEKLRDLEKAGELTICKSSRQDIQELVEICSRVFELGLLPDARAIGIDNASGVGLIIDALELVGIPTDCIGSVSQGYLLTGTIKSAERKLFDGSFVHEDQELMTWCVGNAKTVPKGNASVVEKAASGSAKIDPLMALFNAVQLMSLNPIAKGTSVYEERGILMV